MSRESFEYICEGLHQWLHSEGCNAKAPVPVHHIVGIGVKILVFGSFQRIVECGHAWAQPTVSKAFGRFIQAILRFGADAIKLPGPEEREAIK